MKNTFKFEPQEGLVDVYVGDFKIRNSHNGTTGQVALHLPLAYAEYVTVEPHDQRVGIDVEIKDDKLVRFRKPIGPKKPLPASLMPR